MSNVPQTVVCQRCGRGFIATVSYRDFLARRGIQVKVPVIGMTCFLKTGPMPKRQGEVKWANTHEHVFLHQKQILVGNRRALQEGQAVRFHLHYSPKGPEAMSSGLSGRQ